MVDRSAKTTVEINGRTYDARTGKLLSSSENVVAKKTLTPNRGVVMDGVSRKPAQHIALHPTGQPALTRPKPTTKRVPGQVLDLRAVKKPQRSKTLLRTAVKKPMPSKATALASKPDPSVQLHQAPHGRLYRAHSAAISKSISKFGHRTSLKPVLAPLHVAKAPDISNAHGPVPTPQPQQSAPIQTTPVPHTKTHREEVFAHRIAAANTHLLRHEPKASLRNRITRSLRISPKFVSLGAACLAILVIGGFFAYQRVPSVAMRVAASQAGFHGSLPSQVPSGYAFSGPIRSEKNSIILTYKSRSDSRQILISQRPTDWTSESLLTNYLVDSNLRYQTYQDNGLTIYIYSEGSATWVDQGIWYNMTSQGALNSQQILSLASSM